MNNSERVPVGPTASAGISGLREFVRDIVVGCLALQPMFLKQWEMKHFRRLILGVLFRLDRNKIVVAGAGPAGNRFRMRLGWQTHTDYVLGLYEPEMISVLQQRLRAGDTCVDLGAHVGYISAIMARLVGPRGRVVSFEPVLETNGALIENMRLNGLNNVTVERAAVGNTEGTLELTCSRGEELSWTASATGYSLPGEGVRISVPVFSLDAYITRTGLRPALLKIDVEGAELLALDGARQTLINIRPAVLIEIHDLGDSHRTSVLELLKGCQYTVTKLCTREREILCLALPNVS